MNIVISSVAVEIGGGSSLEQAAAAARRAVAEAGALPGEIDALINIGVYRDSNMVETAMSALIRQQMGLGPEYDSGEAPCLSFDLRNGATGILNAIQVSQALLEAPTVHRVLLVAGDAHPAKTADPQPGFPIKPVGAAMVLEKTTGAIGFGHLHTSGTEAGLAPVELEDLLRHAVSTAGDALEVAGSAPARTVLICNRPAPDFPALLARRLGLPAASVHTGDTEGDAHTAALPAAYLSARDSGGLDGAELALFVAAGAGPSAAAIAYRLPTG